MSGIYPVNPPAVKVITQEIYSFTITSIFVNVFSSATVNVRLFDDKNVSLASKSFVLSGEDYAQWNNDDQYLINWITQQISGNTI